MSIAALRRALAVSAAVTTAAGILVAAPTAHADCTTPGDFGAASGCPPPGDTDTSGSGGGQSWPPTSVDWPPKQDASADASKSDAGSKATPIVMPDGQSVPKARPDQAESGSTPTSGTQAPTPIVMPDTRP